MSTSTTPGQARSSAAATAGAVPRPSEPHALRQGDHPDDRGNFAHDLGPRLEGAARQVDTRFHGPWRSPAAVAVGAYLGAGVLLLVVGWLLVHTPLGGPIRDWDLTISRDLSTGRTSGWTDYSDVGTAGANTLPVIGGMVVVSLVLVALRRWRDLLFLPLGLALELSVFLTVNYLVARERPEVAQLGGEPGTHSFPSGHVAATFVLFASILVLLGVGRWRTPYKVLGWVVAMIPVVSVAFSRVYRGMHFTTDVLAGLALGILALTAAMVATRSSWLGSRPTEGAA